MEHASLGIGSPPSLGGRLAGRAIWENYFNIAGSQFSYL